MARVWARLLFSFTYSSKTSLVRGLEGDGLWIILGGHIMVGHNQRSSIERRECSGEMFKVLLMVTMLKLLRLCPPHVSMRYIV